jgi:branched-subunit amino acid aminotransferase/4-amino-4-deoxychorismate lyase
MHLLNSFGLQEIDQAPSSAYLGGGVFETMRVRVDQGGSFLIAGFSLHCERLLQGAKELGLYPLEAACLRELAALEIAKLAGQSGNHLLRFVACKEQVTAFVSSFREHPWVQSGVRLKSVELTRPLPAFKHSSAIVSLESERRAKEAGFDTALLCSSEGEFTECSWANFIWLGKGGEIYTNKVGVLPGVTRELLGTLVPIEHKPLNREILANGDCIAAVITQATSGVVAVKELDGEFFDCKLAESELTEAFSNALSRESFTSLSFTGSL